MSLYITKTDVDRQLGLGFDTVDHKPPTAETATRQLSTSLVVDKLPGTHPALTKCIDAARHLQLAFANNSGTSNTSWSTVQLHGTSETLRFADTQVAQPPTAGFTVAMQYDPTHRALHIACHVRCTAPPRRHAHHHCTQADPALTPPASSLYAHPRCPTWLAALRPTARATSWHVSIAASIIHGGGDRGLCQALINLANGRLVLRTPNVADPHAFFTTAAHTLQSLTFRHVTQLYRHNHGQHRSCGGQNRRHWVVACRCCGTAPGHCLALRGQCSC